MTDLTPAPDAIEIRRVMAELGWNSEDTIPRGDNALAEKHWYRVWFWRWDWRHQMSAEINQTRVAAYAGSGVHSYAAVVAAANKALELWDLYPTGGQPRETDVPFPVGCAEHLCPALVAAVRKYRETHVPPVVVGAAPAPTLTVAPDVTVLYPSTNETLVVVNGVLVYAEDRREECGVLFNTTYRAHVVAERLGRALGVTVRQRLVPEAYAGSHNAAVAWHNQTRAPDVSGQEHAVRVAKLQADARVEAEVAPSFVGTASTAANPLEQFGVWHTGSAMLPVGSSAPGGSGVIGPPPITPQSAMHAAATAWAVGTYATPGTDGPVPAGADTTGAKPEPKPADRVRTYRFVYVPDSGRVEELQVTGSPAGVVSLMETWGPLDAPAGDHELRTFATARWLAALPDDGRAAVIHARTGRLYTAAVPKDCPGCGGRGFAGTNNPDDAPPRCPDCCPVGRTAGAAFRPLEVP